MLRQRCQRRDVAAGGHERPLGRRLTCGTNVVVELVGRAGASRTATVHVKVFEIPFASLHFRQVDFPQAALDRGETFDLPPAAEHGPRAGGRLINDRSLGRTAVPRLESQRLRKRIRAFRHTDLHRFGQAVLRFHPPHRVSSPDQRGQRTVGAVRVGSLQLARPGVIAVRGDVQGGCANRIWHQAQEQTSKQ